MPYDIHDFVRDALRERQSKERIRAALKSAGWERSEIDASLSQFADSDFPIPVPRRKPYLSAREAFIYLLLFLCLYISAWSFGSLLFHFIERALPDPLNPYFSVEGVRMATSSLIITFPLFMWLSLRIARETTEDAEKKSSKIRKWLTYITLFAAAGVIIGDLIALLYNLLQGELTLRFVLKVLSILLIAGAIFGYYLWDLRKEEDRV